MLTWGPVRAGCILSLLAGFACSTDKSEKEPEARATPPPVTPATPPPVPPPAAVPVPPPKPQRSLTLAERVAELPANVRTVIWTPRDDTPLLSLMKNLSGGPPPCVHEVVARIDGCLQGSVDFGGQGITLCQGELDRQHVESCVGKVGELTGLDFSIQRSGQVTTMSSGDWTSHLGWTRAGSVAWHDDRSVVDIVLAGKTTLSTNRVMMDLVRRMEPTSAMSMASTMDFARPLLGIASHGLLLTGGRGADGKSPQLLANLVFDSPATARRAAAAFARLPRDQRLSPDLRSALGRGRASAHGADLEVDLTRVVNLSKLDDATQAVVTEFMGILAASN